MQGAEGPDWVEKRLDALLEAARTAIQRARYVFIVINVAGLLIVSAVFNAGLTWLRYPLTRPTTDEATKKLLAEVLRKDLSTVSLPLVGVKFSVYDLSVIGSFAMAILALWYFYCVRRENHVVSAILGEAQVVVDKEPDRAKYLYYGIAHYFVFTTATQADVPGGQTPRVAARTGVRALIYMPLWAPALVVVSDYLSLFLTHLTAVRPEKTLAQQIGEGEWIEIGARTLFALAMLALSAKWCRDSDKFDQDTRTQLDTLRRRVEPPAER